MYGIDVRHHNGAINWAAVKTSEVEFAILRAGYGMYDNQKGRTVPGISGKVNLNWCTHNFPGEINGQPAPAFSGVVIEPTVASLHVQNTPNVYAQ